ncbi:tetratricopeptide repeat protein [Acrasis kona]|uniref:Tetratricopeptide repeat protein n=1 Tax=Acrasis kona TaxID=1008807 RepID=A0AAW2YX81_9EUKA
MDRLNTGDQLLRIAKRVIELNEKERIANPGESERIELTTLKESQLINNFKLDLEAARAEALLNKGINLFHTGAHVNGAYQLRKSWKRYESLYKECQKRKGLERHNEQFLHPDLVNVINYGVGTFLFLVGFLPSAITTVLSWIGFKADRELGLSLLQETCEQSLLAGPAASTILSINYLFIPRAFSKRGEGLKNFEPIMHSILKQFPSGSIFLLMAAHYYRKSGDIETSVTVLERSIESARNAFDVMPSMYMFELSQSLIIIENYKRAAELLEKICLDENNKNFDLRGVAALELAVCNLYLDNKPRALELAKQLDQYVNKKSRNDKYAATKNDNIHRIITRHGSNSQQADEEILILLRASHYELLYLRRDIANLSASRAQTMLNSFKSHVTQMPNDNPDLVAACTVIEACLLYQIDSNDDRIELMLKKVLTLKVQHDVQWLACSRYELAEVMYNQEHTQEKLIKIRQLLQEAERYKGYWMEEITKNRIKMALTQVNTLIK